MGERYTAYLYGIQSGLFIKIGFTRDLPRRLNEMNLFNPHPCKVVLKRLCTDTVWVEKRMHAILAPYAIGREWFMIDVPLARATATIVFNELRQKKVDQFNFEQECLEAERARDVQRENKKIIPLKIKGNRP